MKEIFQKAGSIERVADLEIFGPEARVDNVLLGRDTVIEGRAAILPVLSAVSVDVVEVKTKL